MTMADGTEQVTEASEAEPQGQTQGTDAQPAGSVNPNWESLRSEVGDTTFHLLQPHLTKWDQQAQQRITAAQAEAKKYTELGGYDDLQTFASVAQQLDADPQGFYRSLGEELARRGVDISTLTPQQQADALDGLTNGDEEDDEEFDPRDARIAQLEENLERFLGGQEQQAQAQQVASWQSEWDQSFAAAKSAAPWIADEDDEVLRALAAPLFNDDDDVSVTFEKALSNLQNLRNRTLSTPRAGDSAPRLIPSGGGNPAAAQQQDPSKLGRRETVDLVANILRAKQQG